MLDELNTVDYEAITIDNTVGGKGFTSSKLLIGQPGRVRRARLSLETAQIRFTVDGVTAPTTTVGHIMDVGDVIAVTGENDLVNFRAIRTGASSGSLKVSYEA